MYCPNCNAEVEGKKLVKLSGDNELVCEHCGRDLGGTPNPLVQ